MYPDPLFSIRHPESRLNFSDWKLWRDTFEGGSNYRDLYLERWSDRETKREFIRRRAMTPVPAFAKAAIIDVRNNIFQRMGDITRTNGSQSYQRAVLGEYGGVDRKGSAMNSFIGINLLTEMLVMGRAGVFVDAPSVAPLTLRDAATSTPYMYVYRVEDIISWQLESPDKPGQFKSVLLRDYYEQEDSIYGVAIPIGTKVRYRLIWKDEATGRVRYRFLDEDRNNIMTEWSEPDGAVTLDIDDVPFVMPDIGGSLLADAASYQRALLNLSSSDVMWAIRSNFPFLTIQEDFQSPGHHLKDPGGEVENTEELGYGKGRYYGKNTNRPEFIAPPTDPLQASLKLQEKLEDDIRKLVNLAVANKTGTRTESAEAKKLSSQGLEAGLSHIGMVLQNTERKIAELWAKYENTRNPQIANVCYPTRYILKTDEERIDEASSLLDLVERVPGKDMKKQIYSMVAQTLLSGRENSDRIEEVIEDIKRAGYTTSEISYILQAVEAGLCGNELASEALGFREGEVKRAEEDRVKRAIAILAAQTSPEANGQNPASRGVPELDANPQSGVEEQAEGRERKSLEVPLSE